MRYRFEAIVQLNQNLAQTADSLGLRQAISRFTIPAENVTPVSIA